ncbi:uncharacterized protein SPPG_02599 [Spizellomyces punctatus DAOM BR117]|uniref:SH3 domain-containing protein n=1 Tax=Spizellomyces punctatus (strain DAOM BR117) TaxID=645134 RepID=A0A0L0HMH0_SPIPD|nr:uncharacterized protein SPPG_02599 [Spizellomyces punctatus DAOM BR117]KND02100.1 hypothetical protein SPPG_02599 [Spizellomyces punctatus DAOM BR117]|eukprot:XP_016610139.1 hypothetical protein SPPG_02599 [Spizellomyces punctatus DAOM BR117]
MATLLITSLLLFLLRCTQAADLNLGIPRAGFVIIPYSDKFVAFGGSRSILITNNASILQNDAVLAGTGTVVNYKGWTVSQTILLQNQPLLTFSSSCAPYGNSTMLCSGGLDHDHYWSNTFNLTVYNTSNLAAMDITQYPMPIIPTRWDHGSVILENKLYIFGGRGPVNVTQPPIVEFDDHYVIDLAAAPYGATKIVSTKTPGPRTGFCMAALNSTAYVLYGGYRETSAKSYYDDTWIYQPSTGWVDVTSRTQGNPSRRVSPACTTLNGRVYMFGGWGPSVSGMNDVWVFDAEMLRWWQLSADSPKLTGGRPQGRYYCRMHGVGKHLLITGGLRLAPAGSGVADDSALYIFDTVANKWVEKVSDIADVTAGTAPPPNSVPTWAMDVGSRKAQTVGIVLGVLGGLALITGGAYWYLVYRRNKSNDGAFTVGPMQYARKDDLGPRALLRSLSGSSRSTGSTTFSGSSRGSNGPGSPVPPARTLSLQSTQSRTTSRHSSGSATQLPEPVLATRAVNPVIVNRFEFPISPPAYESLVGSSGLMLPELSAGKSSEDDAATKLKGLPHVGSTYFKPGIHQENLSGDEIVIAPGDTVYVRELYADGWACGWNATSQKDGYFPYKCVKGTS